MSSALPALATSEPAGGHGEASASVDDAATATALRARFEQFEALVGLAEMRFSKGDLAAAAAISEIAAHLAFPVHAGIFAAPRLENLLARMAAALPAPAVPAAVPGARRRVLHVLTYARLMGGDGRFVMRWIQADPDSVHSIAVTSQWETDSPVPAEFAAATEQSGGRTYHLSENSSDPVTRALRLRELAANHSVVALHLYPFDTIPVLALSHAAQSASVLFIHHSDHTFWLGRNVMHSLVHLRRPDAALLTRRRGLPATAAVILPIPLQVPSRRESREAAKRKLGIDPNTPLLVTIASPFKYEPFAGAGFRELISPVLAARPDCRLIVVGPRQTREWQALSDATGGRVQALGPRWSNQDLLDAADIYLDSFPFASCTSILEAGSNGLPILSCSPPRKELEMLGAGAPGLELGMLLASDAAHYRQLLTQLLDEPDFRAAAGEKARAQIIGLHTGDRWAEAVRNVYAQARDSRVDELDDDVPFSTGPLDIALVKLFRHNSAQMEFVVGKHTAHLPWSQRLRVLLQVATRGIPVRTADFAPGWARAALRGLRRGFARQPTPA